MSDLAMAVEASAEMAVVEAEIQEAMTERVETEAETAVELAEVAAERDIAVAEIQAEAMVAIAETDEVDGEWLASRLAALEAGHARMEAQLAQILDSLGAIATAAVIMTSPQSTPIPEPRNEPPIVEEVTPETPPAPVVEESQAAQKTRVRRLL